LAGPAVASATDRRMAYVRSVPKALVPNIEMNGC
jgi:hypothetical protein